jgi:hypothetical protein
VIWHTQGSGKSFTMLFFAARVIREPAMQKPHGRTASCARGERVDGERMTDAGVRKKAAHRDPSTTPGGVMRSTPAVSSMEVRVDAGRAEDQGLTGRSGVPGPGEVVGGFARGVGTGARYRRALAARVGDESRPPRPSREAVAAARGDGARAGVALGRSVTDQPR